MKIAYFDLGHSKEQYGLSPTKYGGGAVVARYLKEDPDIEFHIFAPKESFSNACLSEKTHRCHSVNSEGLKAVSDGYPVDEIFKAYNFEFDIILHPHTCASINKGNFKGPVVHFCGFDGAAGHARNDYILLYDETFVPKFGERPKYVKIGKPVPEKFNFYPKAPYVFQCSRHDDHMNSIEVAKNCLEHKIYGYFAGPIHNSYPLMDYIDNKNTHYLGEIDESTKLGFYRHATLFTLLHKWDIPFNQSVIEAQGQGTPILVNNQGPFFSKYLKHGINGFDYSKISFKEAFENAHKINQKNCWESAKEYDVPVMVDSFKKALKDIYEEWYGNNCSFDLTFT